MREAILNFAKQFAYEPQIKNEDSLRQAQGIKHFAVCGMGGSHLAADIIKSLRPELDIAVHSDYGLPAEFSHHPVPPAAGHPSSGRRGKTMVIASSYSGNTEETIDAFETALAQNLPVVAIAVGGKLLELARQHSVPYIELPDIGIQPRSALGFSVMAMLKVMKQKELLKAARELSQIVRPHNFEQSGKILAEKIRGKVPVIYASARNYSVAYNWKIKLNETGKIPAFYNVFPELNHNEMTGFDIKDSSRNLSEKFYFVILKDSEDHSQIQKRMQVLEKLYRERGLPVELIEMKGESKLEKIFNSLLLADWTALYIAEQYGLEPEQVPMVEEFKKLIK